MEKTTNMVEADLSKRKGEENITDFPALTSLMNFPEYREMMKAQSTNDRQKLIDQDTVFIF